MAESTFEKIEVWLKPPFKMNNYVEPIVRGRETGIFQNMENILIDKGALRVRTGLERHSSSPLASGLAIKGLHRTIYKDGEKQLYASISDKLLYYPENGPWTDLSLPSDVTLTPTYKGCFATFKNKTYYTNLTEPVLMIRQNTPAIVNKAGLSSPNSLKVMQNCEDVSEWTASPLGVGSDDLGMAHYVQGDQGVSISQTTPNATSLLSFSLPMVFNLDTFEDGLTATDEDFVAFSAFRFTKLSISQFQIELSTGGTNFTNYYYCPVYVDTDFIADDWDSFSPRQTSMIARWANDPDDFKIFDIKLRKKWFGSVGSPDWTDVRAIRLRLKASGQASTSEPAQVTVDYIRLLKTPPICAPYEKQIAEFERTEAWSSNLGTPQWIDYWSSKGVACLKLRANEVVTLTQSMDLSEYADGVAVGSDDVIQIDVGAVTGSTSLTLTVVFTDGSARIKTFTMGILAILQGAGVTRQKPLSDFGAGAFDWSDVASITITNYLGGVVWIDNLRIGPAKPQKLIDPFMPLDLIAIEELGEYLEPWLRDHPTVAAIAGTIAEWYTAHWYSISGDGAHIYPDWEHDSVGAGLGVGGLTIGAAGGCAYAMTIKRKYNLDISKYSVWSASGTWYALTWANWQAGTWGWLKRTDISTTDNDEFQLRVSSPDWSAVHELKITMYSDSHGGSAPVAPEISTRATKQMDSDRYWEYTVDYGQIQEKILQFQNIQKTLVDMYNKVKDGGDDLTRAYYEHMMMETGGLTDQDTDKLAYIGEDEEGWHTFLLRWKFKDLIWHPKEGVSGAPAKQYLAGYQLAVTAGGKVAKLNFNDWTLQAKGALKGKYWYRIVYEDDEGYYSAPSDISNAIECTGSDAIISGIQDVSTVDTRIRSKALLRLGGLHAGVWSKVKDLAPDMTSTVDKLSDDDVMPFTEEFYYPPPKARYMRVLGNHAWYINIKDRWNREKPSRGYKSRAFAPFQVGDYDCFDIRPEDGDELTGIGEYMGLVVLTKDHSIWTMDKELSQAPMLRTEEAGIIAAKSLCIGSYGIIGMSHKGVIRGNLTQWNFTFGNDIRGAHSDISTEALANAVGFVRDDYYYIFFGSDTNNLGYACYLPTGQWVGLRNITCEAVCLLEGSGEYNRVLYGDHVGYVNYMFKGDTDFGQAIASQFHTMNFITAKIDRRQFLRSVSWLGRYLSVSSGAGGTPFIIGTDIIGTGIIGDGGGGAIYPTVTLTPYKDGVAGTVLTTTSLTTEALALTALTFGQGEEGHVLAIKGVGQGRYAITDLLLDVWLRPEIR